MSGAGGGDPVLHDTVLHDPLQYEQAVPYATLRALRQRAALVWVDEPELEHWPAGPGYWLVLRHKEVGQVLKNPAIYSSSAAGTQLRDPATAGDLHFVQKMMLNMDPPEHTRLRRMLQNAFTSRAIGQLNARINEHAQNLVDNALSNSRGNQCDFVSDLSADMPLLSLADILGMPPEDRYLMFDWANRVIGFQDPEYAASDAFDPQAGSAMAREAVALRPQPDAEGRMPDPRSRSGMPDLYRYAHLLGESKRQQPQGDVMSILMSGVDGDGAIMSIEEFENMFWLFAVAGNETVRNALPGGLIALLENPDQWQLLQQNSDDRPALLSTAVDEMLRWWTPVMIFRRTAVRDTELAGQAIAAGDKVVVSFSSANRDERVFEDPDAFRVDRRYNPHHALGYGPHYCLGAQFGKAQMVAVFSALLERVSSIRSTAKPVYLRSNFQRGVKSLPISWTLTKAS